MGVSRAASELASLDVHGLVKPLLRGRIHLAGLIAAVPAGIALVLSANPDARVGAAVYACTLVALFGASTAYHRLGRSPRSMRVLRRLDHSSIYLLIAGSYTPLCLMALRGWFGGLLLAAVWITAVVGVVLKLGWFDRTNRIGGVLYIVMGWAAVAAMPSFASALSTTSMALLIAGGVIYTAGAVVLAKRFPNPFPRVFGYHEVWHAMVVVAAVLHYAAIRSAVTS